MKVALSRDHRGKPNRTDDYGAGADLNKDGIIHIHEQEAMLTGYVQLAAEARLIEIGHQVIPISDGFYTDRHKRANGYDVDIYVALHLNAGGGDYGAIFHDHRSSNGAALAKAIAKALGDTCDELKRVKVIPAKPDDWTKNAFGTIAGLGSPIGICYEPCFIDSPDHSTLLEMQGLRRLGSALAEGCHEWGKSK